jgi:broad specificity phosphatase PhoE
MAATILFVRHGNALRPSERSPEQEQDPPLSDLGSQQAANLVNVLTPHIEATTGQIKVMSSPMLRCLHTISPTLSALQLPVLVHGEFFEFG